MINLNRLRVFLEVAKHGNYSRAAEVLNVTQPAVSSQIRRLEEDLAVRLLWQAGRVTYLTEAGEALRGYAERLVALGAEARAVVRQFGELKRGRLRIVATTTPGTYLLPQLLAEFRRQAPELDVSLQVGNHAFVVAELDSFRADLAFVAGEIETQIPLTSERLMSDVLVPIAAPGSELAARARVSPAVFRTERLLLREPGSGTSDEVLELLRRKRVKAGDVLVLPSTEAIKQAVMDGLGYAIVSSLAVRRELERGDLVQLKAPNLRVERDLSLVSHQAKFFSPTMRRFLQMVSAKLGDS